MKNNTNPRDKSAGRTENLDVVGEDRTEPCLNRAQILRSIYEAYESGRSVEDVMRERMAVVSSAAGINTTSILLTSGEYGRSVYKKRRCGKVASFFRCLLR